MRNKKTFILNGANGADYMFSGYSDDQGVIKRYISRYKGKGNTDPDYQVVRWPAGQRQIVIPIGKKCRETGIPLWEYIKNNPACGERQGEGDYFEYNPERDAEIAVEIKLEKAKALKIAAGLEDDEQTLINVASVLGCYSGSRNIMLSNILDIAETQPKMLLDAVGNERLEFIALLERGKKEGIFRKSGFNWALFDASGKKVENIGNHDTLVNKLENDDKWRNSIIEYLNNK